MTSCNSKICRRRFVAFRDGSMNRDDAEIALSGLDACSTSRPAPHHPVRSDVLFCLVPLANTEAVDSVRTSRKCSVTGTRKEDATDFGVVGQLLKDGFHLQPHRREECIEFLRAIDFHVDHMRRRHGHIEEPELGKPAESHGVGHEGVVQEGRKRTSFKMVSETGSRDRGRKSDSRKEVVARPIFWI